MKLDTPMRQHLFGIFLILLVFLFTAIINTLGKLTIERVPIGVILFMQNLIAMGLLIPFIFQTQPKGIEKIEESLHLSGGSKLFSFFRSIHTKRFRLHILRALSGLLSYACLFTAVEHISLVNATLLANSAPLFLPFLAIFWMKEKVGGKTWASLLLGFVGVYLILHPSGAGFESLMAIVALFGSFFSAIALQSIRNLKATDSSLAIAFYYFFIASIVLIPFLILQWDGLTLKDFGLLCSMGILLGLTQVFLGKAYQYASPTLLGPFNYSVVVFAGLIQWWIWGVIPDGISFLGVIVVCLGGTLAIIQQNQVRS